MIIERLNNIVKNLNIYNDKFNDIIEIFNDNRNYQIIHNINEFINNNNNIKNELESIIDDKNIFNKLKKLTILYYKLNKKNSQISQFNKEIILINKTKQQEKEDTNQNEISEKIKIKNYTFDYSKKSDIDFILPNITIDNGSTFIRAGFSGDDKFEPDCILPNCIGYPNLDEEKYYGQEYLFGQEIEDNRDLLYLKYPIQRGFVKDIDNLEKIYNHIFQNEIRVDPVEHNIMITGIPMNSKENRVNIGQLIFETFNAPALFF
jgi:hypothetical protein